MEEVVHQIKQKLKTKYTFLEDEQVKVSILFTFVIQALDTRRFHEVETSIREKVGFSLPKEKVKEWGLPVHTEWALTTQEYVDKMKKKTANTIDENGFVSTKVFKSEEGDNKRCDLALAVHMTDEQLIEKLKELPNPFEKDEQSTPAKKATRTDIATPESSKPDASAAQSPGNTGLSSTSRIPATESGKKKSSATTKLSGAQNTAEEQFSPFSPEKEEIPALAKVTKKPSTTGNKG